MNGLKINMNNKILEMIGNNEYVKEYIINLLAAYKYVCNNYELLLYNMNETTPLILDNIKSNNISCNEYDDAVFPSNNLILLVMYISIISVVISCINCVFKCHDMRLR